MHLPGSYRRLIAHPKQLSWKWLDSPKINPLPSLTNSFTSHTAQKTDSTGMYSQPELDSSGSTSLNTQECASKDMPNSDKDQPDLEISFSLEKACYATVLLRELMKQV